MADGRIEGKDIFGPSAGQTIDDLVKGLDLMIQRLQQIRKDGGKAFVPKQLDEYAKAQQKLATTAELAANGMLKLKAEVEEEERLLKSNAREKAKLSKANTELAKENERLSRQRRAAASEQRAEERRAKATATAYGRLQQSVNDLEREYKELAAAGRLNTTQGRKLTTEFNKQKTALDRINRSAKDFRSNVGNYPSAFAGATNAIRGFVGAFGVIEGLRLGVDFIGDSIRIAAAARGVETAFEALGERGVKAFDDIRAATRGTLSDLEIKTSINEFENFNIDLEQTGVLFEFLSLRAAQTGKSVDTLRDSLVEGLSKESKLRIDNLGISTAALNEELEKTPNFVKAVANIARRELGENGAQKVLDDLAKSPEAAIAAFENLKLAIGQSFGGLVGLDFSGFTATFERLETIVRGLSFGFGELFRTAQEVLNTFTSIAVQIPILDKLFNVFTSLFNLLRTDTGLKAIQIGFIRLGAIIQALIASNREFIGGFKDLFEAFIQLGRLDFSNIVNLGASIKDNFVNLTSTFQNLGRDSGIAFTDTYDRVVGEGLERLRQVESAKEIESQRKAGADAGQAKVDAYKEKIKEINDFFEDESIDIFNSDSVDGFVTAVDSASQLFRNAGKALQDEWEEATKVQEAIKNSSLAVVNELEKATGTSFQLIRDLINGTEVETADYLAFTGQATQAILEAQTARIDQQIEENNIALQSELANTALTEEQKQVLRERYAQQEARLKKRQAQQNKRNALFEIAINTAVAVSKALKDLGAFAFVAIAPIIAQGLAQAALVAAQPLPQFFKGKGPLDNYQGWATVGEKGKEVLVRDGQAYETPSTTTTAFIKRDDIIYPSIQEFENRHLAQNGTFESTQLKKQIDQRLQFDYERFQKAMEKALKKTNISVNNKVVVEPKRLRW